MTPHPTPRTTAPPAAAGAAGAGPGPQSPAEDGGFASLELVLIAPVLLVFVLLIVGYGRVSHGHALIEQAAAGAARAAALDNTPGQATVDARADAAATLARAGISCRNLAIVLDTTQFRPGGQVTARLACTADLRDLTIAGFPGTLTLRATSTAPLETHRQLGTPP